VKSYCIAESPLGSALLFSDAPALRRFPEDLRLWVSNAALLRLAQGVAQEHAPATLHPVFSFTARRFHPPWQMLSLLSYSLASGIWHSRATAEIAALDPDLFALCHGEAPSAEVIRQFRGQNQTAIVQCLELLLRRVWLHRHGQGAVARHAFLMAEILSEARTRLRRAEESEAGDIDFADE